MKTALFLLTFVIAALPACNIRAGQAARGAEPAVKPCGVQSDLTYSDSAKPPPRPVLPAHLFM
jgi:hypothetical protein